MEFIKNISRYTVSYSRNTAIKLLRKDNRILKVINHLPQLATKKSPYKNGEIILYTHPIIPSFNLKWMLPVPIGRFKITIIERPNSIFTRIKNLDGSVTYEGYIFQQPHIQREDGSEICWGSIDENMEDIENNKDIYWMALTALNYLDDGDLEDGYEDRWTTIMIGLQIQYALKNHKIKLTNKLIQLFNENTDWEYSDKEWEE